jgi:plasmid stability protein
MPQTKTRPAKQERQDGIIRSMNIPREVRDAMKAEAALHGVSTSALSRRIMEEYVAGKLFVPDMPGPQTVSTSMWVPRELWTRFTRKSESNGHPTQWIFRAWLDRESAAA